MPQPTREQAWALVQEWTKNQGLRHHMLAVEAAMRAYARKYGEDEALWGLTGLVHDMDYERYPDMDDAENGHPRTALRHFEAWQWPPELIHAVAAHAEHLGVAPKTLMARALRACDEITGLITATALVRPSKDIRDVKVKSIKKKWKDKSFTAAIDRDEIARNVEALGEDLTQHMQMVLDAMKDIAAELGLDGRLAR
jgi:putative nucleotidyltransferase with HDIG domain